MPKGRSVPRTIRFRRLRRGGLFSVGPRRRLPISRRRRALAVLSIPLWIAIVVFLANRALDALPLAAAGDLGPLAWPCLGLAVSVLLGALGGWGMLRWAFARNTVLLTRSRWSFRASLLGLFRDRRIDPRRIEDVILVRDRLWIQTRGASFEIIAAGTSADRAWFHRTLRSLLGGRLRRRVAVDHRLRPPLNDVPSGFMLLEDLSGALVQHAPLSRLRRLATPALICLGWNGLLAVAVAALSLADPGAVGDFGARILGDGAALDVTGRVWWLFVSPWLLVGAYLLGSLLVATLDRTRFHVAPGTLHIERRGLGRRDRMKFDGAELFVTVAPTSLAGRPRAVHMLHVSRADGRTETLFQDRSFSRIEEIARWLAIRTGFPVF